VEDFPFYIISSTYHVNGIDPVFKKSIKIRMKKTPSLKYILCVSVRIFNGQNLIIPISLFFSLVGRANDDEFGSDFIVDIICFLCPD
jgi:hypothetical protein